MTEDSCQWDTSLHGSRRNVTYVIIRTEQTRMNNANEAHQRNDPTTTTKKKTKANQTKEKRYCATHPPHTFHIKSNNFYPYLFNILKAQQFFPSHIAPASTAPSFTAILVENVEVNNRKGCLRALLCKFDADRV